MFIFDARILAAYEVCTPEQARQRLRPYVWLRVNVALKAVESRHAAYLHDGHPA
jgi:8-oxo-dGTP diphosphatase